MSDAAPGQSPSLPLHLGAAWQPELWPEDQWAGDIDRMASAGITTVRLFDFAWNRFEPREWEFDFEWATRLLDQLRDAGLRVIVATPTAAPPAWMAAKYPEILQVTPDAKRLGHGRRRHYSVVSSRYREFAARIIDQMVHAFRGHEAIVGWQIDHQPAGADYGPEARRAFHSWLHDRFGHVDGLNTAWGLHFWSQAYEYFEQIPVPPVGDVGHRPIPEPRRHHPSLMVAFQRFINDQWSAFIQVQCEVIRAGFDKPVSTNMTPDWGMNYFRQNQLLDRVSMSLARDVDQLSSALMHLDRMRAEKPGVPFWTFDARSDGRGVPPFAWLSILSGAELHLLDHWRQPWAGQGMGRGGVVAPTGRWTPIKDAVATLAAQLREQAEFLAAHPPVEARLAVMMSNESAWAFSIEPPEPDFEYEQVWRDDFYLPVARHHYWRDVIDQTADYCPYHVILMPLLPIVFRPTKERLKEWVLEGGCLLVGPLTGHRNEEFTAWTDQELGGLEELIGANVTTTFHTTDVEEPTITWGAAPPPAPAEPPRPAPSPEGALDAPSPTDPTPVGEGKGEGSSSSSSPEPRSPNPEPSDLPSSTPRGLAHAFTPTTAHALARYSTGPAAGHAAILMHKLGQGTVLTLGARIDEATYLDLVHTLCELAKIQPLATGSPHVAVIPRMRPDTTVAAYGLVNLTKQPQSITLPKPGQDRLTNRDVGPGIALQPLEVMLVAVV
jgi:beta-galactosidase GanA